MLSSRLKGGGAAAMAAVLSAGAGGWKSVGLPATVLDFASALLGDRAAPEGEGAAHFGAVSVNSRAVVRRVLCSVLACETLWVVRSGLGRGPQLRVSRCCVDGIENAVDRFKPSIMTTVNQRGFFCASLSQSSALVHAWCQNPYA